jgi:hypothetical protein
MAGDRGGSGRHAGEYSGGSVALFAALVKGMLPSAVVKLIPGVPAYLTF